MSTKKIFAPLHGGDIDQAAKHFSIPVGQWLDLSTGMNSKPYPIPKLPPSVFQNLPYLTAEFKNSVHSYYGRADFLASSGSQQIIQTLPVILNKHEKLPVLLPDVGYKEHRQQWQRAGQAINFYSAFSSEQLVADIYKKLQHNAAQHVVIINPNNPTGSKVGINTLLRWSSLLQENAYLIVDEAFIDNTPSQSLLSLETLPNNIIVLRSFGKFFGLAGLRLGFVFANRIILSELEKVVGLWAVNGPAQCIAAKALQDTDWHEKAILKLQKDAVITENILEPLWKNFELQERYNTDFFISFLLPKKQAEQCFSMLALQGVLTRVIHCNDHSSLLRVACINSESSADIGMLKCAIARLLENKS